MSLFTVCMLLLVGPATNLIAQDEGADGGAIQTIKIDPKYYIPPISGDESRAEKAKIRETNKLINQTRKNIVNSLKAGDLGSVETQLADFLNGYIFAQMTQTDPETLSSLGEMRSRFLRDLLSDKVSPAARQTIIERYTIPKLTEIAQGNFHKGARMNAVVLLGLLNDREGDSRNVPYPSTTAFKTLMSIFTDANSPAYLRIGALAGLQRHFETDRRLASSRIDDADKGTVTSQCLAVVNGTANGQDTWPEELSYWLKRRATQVLGSIGDPGTDRATSKAIAKNLYDEEQPVWIRFDSLVALSKMRFDKTLAGEGTAKVSDFVANFLEKEAGRLDQEVEDLIHINILLEDKDIALSGSARREDNSGGVGAGMGFGDDMGGGGGGGKADDEKPKVELPTYQLNDSRKRVQAVVYTASQFFQNDRNEGLLQIVDDTQTTQKEEMTKVLEIFAKVLIDSETGIVDLAKQKDDEDEDEEEEDKGSITSQLAEIYRTAAKDLKKIVARQAPKQNFEDLGDDADKPADVEEGEPSQDQSQDAPGKPGDGGK